MRCALALLAGGLLLAGCGGGSSRLSKTEYEHHLKTDATLIAKAATNASTADFNTPQQYARRVALAQKDMERAAKDLDTITPPADAEQDTKQIVAGVRYLARALARLHHAATTSSFSEAQKVSSDIAGSAEVQGVSTAIKDLKGKGYDVGAFGGP
jgi:outer membrane PBP1 activator LpoA protein